jgi:hypothetical protein
MSKASAIRKKITEMIKNIDDEAVLTAMLVFANSASSPEKLTKLQTEVTAPKPKTSLKSAPIDSRILEYTFKDKPMLAVQTSSKPDEAVIAKFKSLHFRFYSANVPTNPFNNHAPFWAGTYSDEAKAAIMAVV